ncbi:nuclear envelope phosphatase-regulatory subunit 1 isoform X2 [Pantherophis guttatus]|uniref:Nuclear envelope phosphatase-regulatory subunit 1 n=1 Tax=Pantherophis guttatus TaxID=94885 RepID=A0ABM3YQV8_PANGU|nr:nuclear envelope phosphatase-regulatory subunit 1 isoform X2 [Pantherophis guttatus]
MMRGRRRKCSRRGIERRRREAPGFARRWAASLGAVSPLSSGAMNSLEQAEDLKAFERRLTEYIACLQPATGRWRIILIVVSVCTATGAWNWLIDPETQKFAKWIRKAGPLTMQKACFFDALFSIAARCRTVLAEYNMSCDDTGKLILKPRLHVQ